MRQEYRAARYDASLALEVCRFAGVTRPVPSHFHEEYVVGLAERGARRMTCGGRKQTLEPGQLFFFAPGVSHGCTQADGGTFAYRSIHLPRRMLEEAGTPAVSPVTEDRELAARFLRLHDLVLEAAPLPVRQEALERFLIQIPRTAQPVLPFCREEVRRVCTLIRRQYAEPLDLEQMAHAAGLSKSSLLRAFTRTKGVTPYRYLENVRIQAARALLEQGVPPAEAALRTGFSDQSHFTRFFSRFIGLSPGAYGALFRDGD